MPKNIQKKALNFFEKQEFNKALPLFEEVAANDNCAENWFNVATCAVMARQLPQGQEALAKATTLADKESNPDGLSVGMMHFYFMCALRDSGFVEEGMKELEGFREGYSSLKITDDMFLSIRGLPSLQQFLAMGVGLLKMQTKVLPQEWLAQFGTTLDAEGQAEIAAFVKEQF